MKLSEGIALYVEHKRISGIDFNKGHSNFLSLCRKIGDVQLSEISSHDVLRFLNGPKTSTVTFRSKHSQIRYFFEFMASRELMAEIRMPPNRPLVRQTFTPYIYTREELHRLLKATRTRSRWAFNVLIAPQTLRTFLISLYATGSLVSEMIRLTDRDVDLNAGTMTVRSARFDRKRKLPLSADLLRELRKYADWKRRIGLMGGAFFAKDDGTPLVARTMNNNFQRLRQSAGVLRHDSAQYQPRMHDLRATFAVHRIASWIRNKADLNRMLPALAAYMGQAGLTSTERYLYLTPERFRTDLERLSPTKKRRHWRDDPKLIAFLSQL
jgi:integrase